MLCPSYIDSLPEVFATVAAPGPPLARLLAADMHEDAAGLVPSDSPEAEVCRLRARWLRQASRLAWSAGADRAERGLLTRLTDGKPLARYLAQYPAIQSPHVTIRVDRIIVRFFYDAPFMVNSVGRFPVIVSLLYRRGFVHTIECASSHWGRLCAPFFHLFPEALDAGNSASQIRLDVSPGNLIGPMRINLPSSQAADYVMLVSSRNKWQTVERISDTVLRYTIDESVSIVAGNRAILCSFFLLRAGCTHASRAAAGLADRFTWWDEVKHAPAITLRDHRAIL